MQHGHDCPIEEPGSFGAFAHTESLPIGSWKHKGFRLGSRPPLATRSCLSPHGFIAGDGQHVGGLRRFQPDASVQIPTLDGIGNDPGKRNLRLPKALDHLSGQFTFGLKANGVGNTCLPTPLLILSPAQGKIQFPIQQRVAFDAGVGEKDPDLTVLNLARRPTLLLCDTCRFFPSFGKAGLVDHQDGLWIKEALQNGGAQVVAHQIRVPGRAVE